MPTSAQLVRVWCWEHQGCGFSKGQLHIPELDDPQDPFQLWFHDSTMWGPHPNSYARLGWWTWSVRLIPVGNKVQTPILPWSSVGEWGPVAPSWPYHLSRFAPAPTLKTSQESCLGFPHYLKGLSGSSTPAMEHPPQRSLPEACLLFVVAFPSLTFCR